MEKKSNQLLLVFVKNPAIGKVKTRLAKTIGDEKAFKIYLKLLALTEKVLNEIHFADVHVYFSDEIKQDMWSKFPHFVQKGKDLGEKMKNAFQRSFDLGYNNVAIIGSDLPDLNIDLTQKAFKQLEENDVVFGPAKDGGYYLLGMNMLLDSVFMDKPWSTSLLLELTLKELNHNKISYMLLDELNDIDTFEDLAQSTLYKDVQDILISN